MKEKMKWIVMCVIMVAILAAVGFNTANSIRTMQMLNDLNVTIQKTQEEEKTQEDDVLISESYRIKSTVHISNAYKSGDTSNLDDRDKETLDMASAVLDEIIEDGMTPYEKERAVYDWMTHKLQFDQGSLVVIPTTQADCENPYGVLKHHNAVCVGYATTFRLFMQMLDIECMVVHNTSKYHTWNLVKLDNEWYHTDIYSDAGSGNYVNFNLTDAMMSRDHSWDMNFFPAAQSLEYNIGYQNRHELTDVYQIPVLVKEMLDREESSSCFVGYEGGFQHHEQVLAEQMLTMIEERFWETELSNDTYIYYSWVEANDGEYYVNLNVTKSSTESDSEIEPVELEKLEYAVNEIFEISDWYGEMME